MQSFREFVPLAPLTTLGVGGSARYYSEITDEAALESALAWADERGVPVRILGGGSNVVIGDAGFDGLVLRLATRGVSFAPLGTDVELRARAGEAWDEIVAASVSRGLQGLECLSGIPGSLGATPIQNVGAYGQEVAESIVRVRVLERSTRRARELSAAECRFAYRDSFFKSEAPDQFVVLEATFRLRSGAGPAIRYAELERHLASGAGRPPSLAEVRQAVLTLRRAKSMVWDETDENRRSCGSFFVNPIVAAERAREIQELTKEPGMPRYPQPDGRVKLAAAWLIERAGFGKGTRKGAVGLSTRHALAIVCHDGARAEDVLDFARSIQAAVRERFRVELVPEPVVWA